MSPNSSSPSGNSTTDEDCMVSGTEIFLSFYFTFALLFLPLCVFILYRGFLQWRQQRSTSPASMMSHSDSFTYQVVFIELVYVLGTSLFFSGYYRDGADVRKVKRVGYVLATLAWYGETFFHTLTCVDRYLAVVHPITYLSLRGESGLRVRHICSVSVWLLCTVGTIIMALGKSSLFIDLVLLVLCFLITCFCSFSVLCALVRPGPGEQGRAGDRVSKSKQRAFNTITVITGATFIRCIWNLIWTVFYLMGKTKECDSLLSEVWFNLPSSLVLPLLYLQRAGPMGCVKKTSN